MANADEVALQLTLNGRVQGVGFRPFVYKLALRLGLTGWVRNHAGEVAIVIQGAPASLQQFQREVLASAPPQARPNLQQVTPIPLSVMERFVIVASTAGSPHQASVPLDLFTCADCLAEMQDTKARRYRYPFINCTQCGPRYTLIAALPYDRAHTAMAGFALCPDCLQEYRDLHERRFHAEPLACPLCGPELCFVDAGKSRHHVDALHLTITALREGQIVGVKGIGGYHLLCLATDDAAILRLRKRKVRPDKPFAVMAPWQGRDGLDSVRRFASPSPQEEALLVSALRPIVLLKQRTEAPLALGIAPRLQEVGVMLPYSPLHYLLLDALGVPIVATSGNVSGEPVLTDPDEAEVRLGHVAEAWLHHNRPILRPADDAVYRTLHETPRPLRLGRGNAPLELYLPHPLTHPVLALGGQGKNTLALAWRQRVVISPHIGNLDTPRGMDVFTEVADKLQALYGVTATGMVCDAHPGYSATRFARQSGLPVFTVAHHMAHASALLGEHDPEKAAIVFTWDGVGLGEDGTLWGGEALVGCAGAWRRRATFRPFRPPGGDRAALEPWRSLLALCWEIGQDTPLPIDNPALVRLAWEKGLNSPATSAVGRLFDAAAARILGLPQTSFEGQAPMRLEAAARGRGQAVALPLTCDQNGLWTTDWRPWLESVIKPCVDLSIAAADFHTTLAHALLALAQALREESGVCRVGLSGGVFQNRRLTEEAHFLLEEAGFTVLLSRQVPCNDGGLSFGQVVEFLYTPREGLANA